MRYLNKFKYPELKNRKRSEKDEKNMKKIITKAIIVSGTPGTGKTRFAKKLARQNNWKYIDVTRLIKIKENGLSDGYDKKRKCIIVDEKKLVKLIVEMIQKDKKKLVIDSHMAQFVPKKYVDKCYVTKCNLKELKKRLQRRKYDAKKLKENMECEIFDVCLEEARSAGHAIKIVWTSGKKDQLIEKKILNNILIKNIKKIYQ